MTDTPDMPANPAAANSPDPGPARTRGRRAAMLLAAAAPLAAALATAPAATAHGTAAPAAIHVHALITGTLPATTTGTGGTDPKLPPYVGD